MALYLLLIDGDNETRYKIVENLTIGRSGGGVQVPDPAVSTRHAMFKYSSKEGWSLLDLGSRNGIVSDGRRLRQIQIKHGVKFMIGKANFKTIDIEDTQASVATVSNESGPDEVSLVKESAAGWQDKMRRLTRGVDRAVSDSSVELAAFTPKINLKFVRGVQYPTEWVLEYGPREFGSGTPEHPLFEPLAPETSFSLTPSTNGVVFKAFDSEKVLLNGSPTKTDILKAGDEIEILATKIVVSFIE